MIVFFVSINGEKASYVLVFGEIDMRSQSGG